MLLITAADAAYFPLLQDCILSICDKEPGESLPIAVFDLGCTSAQITWLTSRVDFIRKPDWHEAFNGRDLAPGYLQGLLARPYLREYFPGFEIYLWLDADAWVQSWDAIELFLTGARRKGLAIVAELDRGSWQPFGGAANVRNAVYRWYLQAFGPEVAKRLQTFPLLNAGVFALRHDAPHWRAWQRSLRQALVRGCNLLTDQMALNCAVYQGLHSSTSCFLPGAIGPATSACRHGTFRHDSSSSHVCRTLL